MNVCGVNDVRQTKVRTLEPQVPELSAFDVERAIIHLTRHKSPGIDQIPAELIKAGVEQLAVRSFHLFILFCVRRNCLSSGSRSLYLSIKRVIKQIVVIIKACHFCQLRTEFYPTFFCQV